MHVIRLACFCLVTIAISYHNSSSQLLDSIRYSIKQKPKFLFKLDTRNSFISNNTSRIIGWKIGAEFNERIRIGGGVSRLSEKHSPSLDKVIYDPSGLDTLVIAKLSFMYITYFIDYVVYRKNRWEISVPIQFGVGNTSYKYIDSSNVVQVLDKGLVLLYEPSIAGHYKLTRWFGLGFGAGFRLMLINNKNVDSKFNSAVYVLKIKLFLSEIFKRK